MSVEIKGLDSLRRKLQSLGGELEQATEKGVEKATKTVQTAAKLLCPAMSVRCGSASATRTPTSAPSMSGRRATAWSSPSAIKMQAAMR